MMVYVFMIHMASPSCYDTLRSNSLLILPHEKRLIQVSQSRSASVDDIRRNKHFLKIKSDDLVERGKYVVMEIDEIYVKKQIDYKNGKLYRYAENSSGDNLRPARTIYAMFACSAFRNFKEIVSLQPVDKITTNELTTIVKQSAVLLRECGL